MPEIDARLREDVHQLGELLGDTIREQYGPRFLDKIELIRKGAKAARRGSAEGAQQLTATLDGLEEDELLPVARAFNQFLNLANIAEQYHRIRRRRPNEPEPFENLVLEELLGRLKDAGHAPGQLARQLAGLEIELVLTAHPTEVARRTLIQKYDAITAQLAAKDHADLLPEERSRIQQRLQRLVAEAWHTDEIRKVRPTPVDEAKWGFAVIEHSLWQALPNVLRHVDEVLLRSTGERLPLTAAPLRFASWMGGDRDGNPNVTASVTREVLLLARWMAADLYLRDIDRLLLASGEISVGVSYTDELPANAKRKTVRRSKPKILRADSAPGQLTLDDYCARPHALVSFAGDLSGFVDEELEKFGRKRKVVLAVPQFNGLGTLLAGTDIIATVPDYAAQALIAAGGLRAEDPPFETRAFELSMAWRGAQDNDPAERWLRSRISMFIGDPDSL
ncbi:phosphoenolpyruvate carboxylase [Pseudomonas aeruginosa]|uniref:phosphoenolpyruvate carboxylase n=1 Tax=Pseudomonas aeruginosa TaxID=287 RepID=UPI003969946B